MYCFRDTAAAARVAFIVLHNTHHKRLYFRMVLRTRKKKSIPSIGYRIFFFKYILLVYLHHVARTENTIHT